MNYKNIILVIIIFVLCVTSISCTSTTEPSPENFIASLETPVVTGIYVTTVENPEGNRCK